MAIQPVHQLLYRSAAAQPFSDSDLEELVVQARRNNLKNKITGMLIYSSDTFVQMLEGDIDSVLKVFESIEQDPRHHAVTRVGEQDVAEREFADWAMGWEAIEENIPDGLADMSKPITVADVQKFNTLGGYQLLRSVNKFDLGGARETVFHGG